MLAAGFALAAFSGPVSLGIAAVRPASGQNVPMGAVFAQAISVPCLLVIGSLGSAFLAGLLVDLARVSRIKSRARTVGRISLRNARLAISPAVKGPAAVGFRHPAILFPDTFRAQVDADEWDAVVAHESAHLARGDDWAKAVQSVVLCVGWWLPGLWFLGRALDLEREVASDERAAASAGHHKYASCLLRLASDCRSHLPAPAFGARRSQVAQRVERLLRTSVGLSPLERTARIGLAAAATLAVLASACAAVPAFGPPRLPHTVHASQMAVVDGPSAGRRAIARSV